MQSSRPTAPVLRKACLAAALAVATGSAFALDAGGFMRTAADTASPPPANSAPGMPGRAEINRDTPPPAAGHDMSTDKAKQAVTDSTITTKIKTKLLSTKDLKSTGIHIKTTPTDFYPIEQVQMMKFSGEKWELFGPVIDGHAE